MGRMAYALRLIAGLVMAVAVIFAFVSMSDALENLGRPEGERVLGATFLVSFACFLIAFLSAGILWVLTDISQQLELSRKPITSEAVGE
jgi:NADH:ubiquinone oxidoreductase subunit 6 (subunit J)